MDVQDTAIMMLTTLMFAVVNNDVGVWVPVSVAGEYKQTVNCILIRW